jgi:AraC-like DNA-binding protein
VGQLNQQHPTISTQIVRHIRDCLELAGIPSATLLDRHGIVPDTVDDRNDAVSLADYVRFFEDAAEEAGNPHFGMHAARVMSADGLGPLSFLFLSAPTLGQAFHTFTEHLDAMQEATFNAFIVEDSISHFTYGIRDDALAPRRQDSEYSIGVMCNLMRQYLGRRSAPAEVHFEHERVGALSWYESYFDCPVYFEQPHNRLYLPVELLDRGSTALSTALFPIIADHLKARMHVQPNGLDTIGRVRDILMSFPPHDLPSLDQTAKLIGCSRATLMRRLSLEGQRYGELVTERRLGHARQLLRSSNRSIADIALASGYSEAASFTRAFQKKSGSAPSRWRRDNSKRMVKR